MSDAYDEGARFLARRMRTVRETRRHLEEKGFSDADIRDTLSALTENKALDDAEYAAVYARQGVGKGKSSARIRTELKARGISATDTDAGLARIYPETGDWTAAEGERARSLAAAILGGNEAAPDSRTLAKAGRKLAGLGYDPELIYKILGEYMQRGKP